jgi:hypothetical protein
MRRSADGKAGKRGTPIPEATISGHIAADIRPTDAQRRYLQRGLAEPGGKLPLFDRDGREVPRKTVESCVQHGWAAPWVANPVNPSWLVCRLTEAGYRVLGAEPPVSIRSPAAALPPATRD